MESFRSKTAIVTGAASGIGRALSEALVAAGAHVVLADVDAVGAQTAAKEVTDARPGAGSARAVALDVTDARRFADIVSEVSAEHGQLDYLVNNAGTLVAGEVCDLTVEHWHRVLDVNLGGVVHGVAAAYPLMVKQGQGHIVNIASLAGLSPVPLLTPYTASKFAVVGLSFSLRAEAAPHGVRVSVVCPSLVNTPLLDRLAPDGLATASSAPEVRRYLGGGPRGPYPPSRLAIDVLKGISRNRPIIIAPRTSMLVWYQMRVSPRLTLWQSERSARRELRNARSPNPR